MIFIAIIMFVIALLGLLLFGSEILFGIIMILCAAGVLINDLLLKKWIKKSYIRIIISAVLIAAFLACALFGGIRKTDDALKDGSEGGGSTQTGGETEKVLTDEELLDAAFKAVEAKNYGSAEEALSEVSESAKKTEEYYIIDSDILVGKEGFEKAATEGFLDYLEGAVDDCPGSPVLNYRAGIVAYALEKYNTAENYLARAYELSPSDDPYPPYALAAVYKHLGEDDYAYAFMTIAEKNGILEKDGYDEEGIIEWYRNFGEKLKETEKAE